MTLLLSGAIAIVIGATLQRLCGAGVGMVVAPTLALVLGPAEGVLVTNGASMVSGFMIMLAVRRDVDWRRAAIVCLAAIPGAFGGALLVRELSAGWLQVLIGVTVLSGLATTVAFPQVPEVRGRAALVVAGTFGGFFNTTAGVAAPAMVIYSRMARWEQRSFAATLQPIFMTMGALSVTTKTALGSVGPAGPPPLWFAPVVVGSVLAGVLIGGRLSRHVSSAGARRMALTVASIGATLTVARGLALLVG
ncbi:MAG: sulfite exporter TauE/SafE family protein [Austwickia sp.]|jgi:uncharacterized protein|nr:sulfite exporter TauE/SafE family protein [Austwickia sp.]MBK8436318.1 sulfite exporter TauE/SafE family protein [Austwickia sp.]MBK9101996.1 sulfite exporter TauE/SafE family protein [Austwickia sp.]